MGKTVRLGIGLAVVAALAACGDDGSSETADGGEAAGGGAPTIVAENISMSPSSLELTAGQEVTITYDNRDSVPHNLRINELEEVATEITSGPVEQTLTFTPDAPGELTYQCDVHPSQMSGVITVS